MPIMGDLYKQIGRSAAGAVCIAAAYDAVTDAVVGLTASSFVTLSFDPVLFENSNWQLTISYRSISACSGSRETFWRCSLRAWRAGSSGRGPRKSNI